MEVYKENPMIQQATQESNPIVGNVPTVLIGQSVIPLVNKLQDIFSQLGSASSIDLPQVAVIGSQSSGKSSVLEALVGRDFLPRGADICTRRPLVLQLIQLVCNSDDKSGVVEWGEFLHTPGKRFTDFSLIWKEIQAETEKELGSNKGISDKQIRLKIFSPHVLNITLVDLPGITKVPVGDQPSDIESRVRTLVLSYIKHETCIILAVSPANADLANSDSLQMARMADPDGSRTIGVITKLDIMDRGTDARNLLLGNIIPLHLGYVGVVNRSQEDIARNKSIRDALLYEENFFRSRPIYHGLSDRCGIPQLAIKLNSILLQHIKAILPDMKTRINTQIIALSKELACYGELTDSKELFETQSLRRICMSLPSFNREQSEASSGKQDVEITILQTNATQISLHGQNVFLNGQKNRASCITRYSQGVSSIINGNNEEVSTSELSGGARLHYIFQNIFVKSINEVEPCEDLTDEDIKTAIQNATGAKNTIFVPEIPFEVLVRRQISRLLDPSLQCARFIYDELVKIAHRCESNELRRFPILRKRVEEVVANFLRDGLIPAETMICHLIEMEMDYINTSHPSFIGGSKAVELALQQNRIARQSATAKDISELKDPLTERNSLPSKSRAILGRATQVDQGTKPSNIQSDTSAAGSSGGSWGISSIFSGNDTTHSNGMDPTTFTNNFSEPISNLEPRFATIQLREPPAMLRASETQSEQDSMEIDITRMLIKSYYDIVRKNIQDAVPKAIMHFLVNHTKRDLHNVFIRKLYRENLFEEMLQEREEVASKRKRCKEVLRVLHQAAYTLEELPLNYEIISGRSSTSISDETGLPPAVSKASSSISFSMVNGELGPQSPSAAYINTLKNNKTRKTTISGEHTWAINNENYLGNGDATREVGLSYPSLYM